MMCFDNNVQKFDSLLFSIINYITNEKGSLNLLQKCFQDAHENISFAFQGTLNVSKPTDRKEKSFKSFPHQSVFSSIVTYKSEIPLMGHGQKKRSVIWCVWASPGQDAEND